ncbi:MAG: BCCT family transporter, partial [Prevotellamassilia sp.]
MSTISSKKIDWATTLIPFFIVLGLMAVFMIYPESSKAYVDQLRSFFGDTIGLYYVLLGTGSLAVTLFLACNAKYAHIRLGKTDRPAYGNFAWGTMIFTSTMAADIMFYSLCEWALYGAEPHLSELGTMQMWAPTFTLFHWGPIAWSFYVVLAVCFGFMMHVRKRRRQR